MLKYLPIFKSEGGKKIEEIVNIESTVTSRKDSGLSLFSRGFSQFGLPHKIFVSDFLLC